MNDDEQRQYKLKLHELNKLKFAPEVFVKTVKSRNGEYAITKVTYTYVAKLEDSKPYDSYNNNYSNNKVSPTKPKVDIEAEVDKFSEGRNQDKLKGMKLE